MRVSKRVDFRYGCVSKRWSVVKGISRQAMTRAEFIKKALAFALQCTAIYQGLQPNNATFDVVTMDAGKVKKFRYEGETETER
uniref:Protein kinase domain-containing protein n=1 Tax=Bursaphelenchus xylophilus TaxID=6326 RepID=A0A1I7SIX5_BURXY